MDSFQAEVNRNVQFTFVLRKLNGHLPTSHKIPKYLVVTHCIKFIENESYNDDDHNLSDKFTTLATLNKLHGSNASSTFKQ